MLQETASQNRSTGRRVAAVVEVCAVFLVTWVIIWATARLPIDVNTRRFVVYTIMMAVPLLVLLVTRRDLQAYGLFFGRLRDQLNITLAILPLTILNSAIYGWLLPMWIPNAIIVWNGALITCAVGIGFFFWTAWILRSKPSPALALALPALLWGLPLVQLQALLPAQLVSFLFYLLFLGPGEEFFFRGYIQSRLNAAFGRPFNFWGVAFGWGLIITSLMFGFMHVIGQFNPFTGQYTLNPWWGLWTIVGGLTFGYIREKAGSVLPTAILHGLPQAIASLFLGFFAVR